MSSQSDTALADIARQLKSAVPSLKAIPGELRYIASTLRDLQGAVEHAARQRERFAREVIAVLSAAKGDGDEPEPE